MPTIDPLQWRPLFDAVYEMNTAKDHADFLSAVVAGMARLISADLTVVHMLDRKTQRLVVRTSPENPYTEAEMGFYAANPGGDPLVSHFEKTGDQQASRTSDVIAHKAYLQTPHFIHCQKRLGFIHTLALPVKINTDVVGALSFDRTTTNFTKRHCALLDAFAPHFVLAWNRNPDPWIIATEKAEPVRARLQKLGLTEREAEVLYWMTEGKQNREIATILGRSLGTVQEHVANILKKLEQENRHAATVFALRSL
ncbi:MAG: LuxR C-terminal-related transcriptional regulator [Verrucomicrobia bacterium]|nr:LuxR C-terminal-related transcriptional regulator [Verrucomicrobiota bacterium]